MKFQNQDSIRNGNLVRFQDKEKQLRRGFKNSRFQKKELPED
jgi:hypothetical protein